MTEVKTFFGRVGGKARIAPWIIEHIKRHNFSIYVEPFAGSGAVYFRMVNDKIFETIRARGKFPRIVLNDADSSIVKIFKACRDYPELLAHAIHYTPYSREEHAIAQGKRPQLNPDENLQNLLADIEEARQALVNIWQSFKSSPGDSWGTSTGMHREGSKPSHHCSSSIFSKLPERILAASPHLQRNFEVDLMNVIQALDDMMNHPDVVKKQVEEARQALVNIWQSFSKIPGGSWPINISDDSKPIDRQTSSFSNLPERIMNATTALKSCYIENDDALKVMQRWSTKQTLFYLDPPYVSCESYYEYNKTRGKDAAIELHYNLASLANSIECAGIVLSYYPNELLDELYPEEFWERHYKSVLASSAGITRTSKNQNRPERTELLLVRKKTNTEIKANYQGQLSLL